MHSANKNQIYGPSKSVESQKKIAQTTKTKTRAKKRERAQKDPRLQFHLEPDHPQNLIQASAAT